LARLNQPAISGCVDRQFLPINSYGFVAGWIRPDGDHKASSLATVDPGREIHLALNLQILSVFAFEPDDHP
jgi:hypothetical protein